MPAEELAQRLPIISLGVNRCAAVRGQVREIFLNPFVVDFVNRGARLWQAHAFNPAASALTPVRQTSTSSNVLRLHLCRFAIARREFERDLAVLPEHKPGGEWPAGFGDEFFEQVSPAGGQQFDDLLPFEWPLQDRLAGFELARFSVTLRFLAEIISFALKHARAAPRAFTQRFLATEIEFWPRLLGLAGRGNARFAFAFARLELETHLAAFPDDEVSRKRPALFGNEFWQQFGLAGRQQPGHLRALHRLLQNDFPRTKIARLRRAGRFLADVAHPALEHARAALEAFAERFLAGEVHFRHLAGRILFFLPEVKLRFEFVRQFDDRGKGPALLAAKPLQRPDRAPGDQFLNFLRLKLPSGRDFPERKVALLVRALKLFVGFLDDAAAFRTGYLQLAEVPRNRIVLVPLGLLHDVTRHRGDFLHELLASQPATLHLLELELPVARQLLRNQFWNAQSAQQGHERERLGGRLQFPSRAQEIFFINQTFDDGRARGRRAEAFLAHRLAQFLVLDQFARPFHRAEQRGFGEARRRFGLIGDDFNGAGPDRFIRPDRHQTRRVVALRLPAVHFEPTGFDHHLAFAIERLALDPGDARRDQEFRRRIEDGQKPLRHHVIKLGFVLVQMFCCQ